MTVATIMTNITLTNLDRRQSLEVFDGQNSENRLDSTSMCTVLRVLRLALLMRSQTAGAPENHESKVTGPGTKNEYYVTVDFVEDLVRLDLGSGQLAPSGTGDRTDYCGRFDLGDAVYSDKRTPDPTYRAHQLAKGSKATIDEAPSQHLRLLWISSKGA